MLFRCCLQEMTSRFKQTFGTIVIPFTYLIRRLYGEFLIKELVRRIPLLVVMVTQTDTLLEDTCYFIANHTEEPFMHGFNVLS